MEPIKRGMAHKQAMSKMIGEGGAVSLLHQAQMTLLTPPTPNEGDGLDLSDQQEISNQFGPDADHDEGVPVESSDTAGVTTPETQDGAARMQAAVNLLGGNKEEK